MADIILTNGQTIPSDSILFKTIVSIDNGQDLQNPINLIQYDSSMAVLCFSIFKNNKLYIPNQEDSINFRMSKPDNHSVYNPILGLDENSNIYVLVTTQMTSMYGSGYCCLEISSNNGVKNTRNIPIYISKNPVQNDSITSSDEYKSIAEIIEEAKNLENIINENKDNIDIVSNNIIPINNVSENIDSIKSISDNISSVVSVSENENNINIVAENAQYYPNVASNAILSRSWAVGGTGSRVGEDTDNAKYYAEQAQIISQGYLGYYDTGNSLNLAHPSGENGQWAIVGDTGSMWIWNSEQQKFTDTLESVNLSNFYSKEYIDDNYYNKSQSDSKYVLQTYLDNYYTSSYINNNYYTQSQSDNKYALKTSLSDYYTSSYIVQNYYTKDYMNSNFASKNDLSSYCTTYYLTNNYYSKTDIKTINSYKYKATFYYSSWAGSSSYSQTVTLYAIDGGPSVTSSSIFMSAAMYEQTSSQSTNETLANVLGIINNGNLTLGYNRITSEVWEKPESDIEIILIIKQGSM